MILIIDTKLSMNRNITSPMEFLKFEFDFWKKLMIQLTNLLNQDK